MANRKLKKIAATVAAVAMLAGSVSASLNVFAGEQLGPFNFEEGIGLPWHICESGPAKMNFDISGGKYNIEILNPGGKSRGGEDRWDAQLRHRGLHMEASHTYKLTYTVSSDTAGYFYAKIGDLEGNVEAWHGNGKVTIEGGPSSNKQGEVSYDQAWDLLQIGAGDTMTVTAEFQPKETVEVAEWAFHFGGDGEYGNGNSEDCFPEGTKLSFSNMSLVDTTSDEYDWPEEKLYSYKDISVNQLGYLVDGIKQATYAPSNGEKGRYRKPVSGSGDITFSLCKDGKEVYTGKASGKKDADSGNTTYVLDFSDYAEMGTGYTVKVGSNESYPFMIGTGADIYKGLYDDALNYFYLNRSGVEIESKYVVANNYDKQIKSAEEQNVKGSFISKENLAREAGHPKDVAYIQQTWIDAYCVDGSDVYKTESQDVTGGWYDAGDYGKYVVNGGISVWTLMNIYERAIFKGAESNYGDGTLSIPESSNKAPDILDEVKWEMDFFRKMICKSGPEKGMVYHKMHDFKWTGLAVSPAESTALSEGKDSEKGTLYRIIKPVSTAATLNFAATAAQFARLYADYDSSYCSDILEEAETAYAAALENDDMVAPLDQNRGGGPYGDNYFGDEFYWAACELYLTTGDASYLEAIKQSKHYLEIPVALTGGENKGDIGSFNWGNTQGLGSVSLLINSDGKNKNVKGKVDGEMLDRLTKNILLVADDYYDIEEKQGYGVPFGQSTMTVDSYSREEFEGYTWGSNSFVINNGIVFGLAYDFSDNPKYLNGLERTMDYIFGRNPNEISFVTGYGSHHTTFVHHRYWSGQLDAEHFPVAPSGVLSGGPNSGLQDPYVKGAGYLVGKTAPQLCYLDHIEAWSANECTVNWNAPLAWMADFMINYQSVIPGQNHDPIETTVTEKDDILYGDLNDDGTADLTDLTLLSVYLMTKEPGSSIKNIKAGDVDGNGTVDIADLPRFKQYVSKDANVKKLGPQ